MTWQPIDLATLEQKPPALPTIGGIIYPGLRHVFSGPPEAAKTWVVLAIALQHLRRNPGDTIIHIDFEMYAHRTRDRLQAMGATTPELTRFIHYEPETPADDTVISELVAAHQPTFAIIDAAAGAYTLQNLDDGKRLEVELFARTFIDPFRTRNVATILLDHVIKNQETRGQFAIGSERKIGSADVHLGFEKIVPFGRGRIGLAKIVRHKDRDGYLPAPTVGEFELKSDSEGTTVTWEIRLAIDTEDWKPTALMEKISRWLEEQTGPVSRAAVERAISGKAEYKRRALDELFAAGNITRDNTIRKPYRDHTDTSPPPPTSSLVPTSSLPRPDEPLATSSRSSPPSRGARRADEQTQPDEQGHLVPAETSPNGNSSNGDPGPDEPDLAAEDLTW